jgi:predicted dinucleotide-binding enzyme
MSYAIIGFGDVGQALATASARRGLEVAIASKRPAEALAPIAKAIRPAIHSKSLQDALQVEVVLLAVYPG